MLAPLRRAFGVALHAGLFVEGAGEHGVELAHFAVVPLLGCLDGTLGQVVAQDVAGVHGVHALAPLGRLATVAGGALAVVGGPGVEAGEVDELVAQYGHGLLGRVFAEAAEEVGVVHRAGLHQLQQALHPVGVVVFGTGQAEAAAHQVQPVGLVQGQEQPEGFAQFVHLHLGREGLGEGGEVPVGDGHLVAEAVAAAVVGVVADVVGVEVVEEGVGAEVEGDAEDRHVVGVHHAVAEAVGLPAGDEFGVALDDVAEHRRPGALMVLQVGEVAGQDVLAEGLQLLVLAGVVEVFEVAEAHVAGRHAQQGGAGFAAFAVDRGAGADHAQGAAAGDAEGVQVFAGEEFADGAAQHGAAVAHARVGGLPGALEVQVPVLAGLVDHFAQQQAAAVAEARVVGAELVAGIDHGPGRGVGPEAVPAEQFGEQRAVGFGRVQVQQG